MHEPYEHRLKHPADFRVKYSFYSENDGGRKTLPWQGIRSDFAYYHEGSLTGNFMIWPEFEDENGNLIIDNHISVPATGTARMWVILPERRALHGTNIQVGTIGYFMEGGRKTAECEVIEIIGLNSNPRQ